MPNARRSSVDELRRTVEEFLPKAEAASRRALQLDPNLADGYLGLGRVQRERGKFLLAEELFSKALALDPNNPDTLSTYSNLLAVVGRLKEALTMKQLLLALEPYVPGYIQDTAEIMWLNGQTDAAIAMLKESPNNLVDVARIYAAMGNYSEAADALEQASSGRNTTREMLSTAARLIRAAPAVAASPQSLPHLVAVSWVYLYVGAPNRALEYFEDTTEGGLFVVAGSDNAFLWHSSYAPVRKTERFKTLIRKSGYVEYWRAKGWPQFCHPVGAADFACD
jgi:tetratricopeptide (TPR) repeat protein